METVFLSLLLQKKELVFRLMRMMNDTPLTETDAAANAERYIGLVEAREEVINELKKLNGELANLQEPPGVSREAGLLNREIKEMLEQIVRLEPELRGKAANIRTHLQQEIKNINNRKKISGAYDTANFYGG